MPNIIHMEFNTCISVLYEFFISIKLIICYFMNYMESIIISICMDIIFIFTFIIMHNFIKFIFLFPISLILLIGISIESVFPLFFTNYLIISIVLIFGIFFYIFFYIFHIYLFILIYFFHSILLINYINTFICIFAK